LRGTYAGLTCPPALDYLHSLGITAVELMPVHQFIADKHLVDRGGAEGPTDDSAILTLRERQKRNFLATLLLSQGVRMLLAADEIGRTQQRKQQRLLSGQ
jgi:pullulanase/glycogen debranching enzyme